MKIVLQVIQLYGIKGTFLMLITGIEKNGEV